jgi:predicted ArsR family transcriptional regulator
LYVCGDSIQTVADWFDIDKKQVKKHLCNLVKGVKCG